MSRACRWILIALWVAACTPPAGTSSSPDSTGSGSDAATGTSSGESPSGELDLAGNDPGTVARAFYDAYFSLPAGGVPDEEGRELLAPYFTPSLAGLLEDAAAAEERYAAAEGDVPPLIEGDLFTSLFEGATALEGQPVCNWGGDLGEAGYCTVDLVRQDAAGESNWTDTLRFRMRSNTWLIDNIEYGGAGEFNPAGNLRDTLLSAIAEAPPPPDEGGTADSGGERICPWPDNIYADGSVASPENVAGFYDIYFTLPHTGIPDAAAREELAPYLASDLNCLLELAADAEERFAVSHPGETLQAFAGDIFTGNPEGATQMSGRPSCEIVPPSEPGLEAETRCEVMLLYDWDAGPPSRWEDEVSLLYFPDGKWLIHGIAFGGSLAGGELYYTLLNGIAEEAERRNE